MNMFIEPSQAGFVVRVATAELSQVGTRRTNRGRALAKLAQVSSQCAAPGRHTLATLNFQRTALPMSSFPCRAAAIACSMLLALLSVPASAQPSGPDAAEALRDGQRDFDFEIGVWKTHLRRRLRPLTGSEAWVEYEGTTRVSPVWGGDANLVELDVNGPAGRIQALSLRLYDPRTRKWSLNFAGKGAGSLATPAIGAFAKGRGEFYNRETLDGRMILVRFVISEITDDACRFEQAFSADDGKTWEVNWIAVDTRLKGAPSAGGARPPR
jgi:hypothetical protein